MSKKGTPKDAQGSKAPATESKRPEPTVVGIGASAGGLAALKEFFQHVPADSGLAFVVVVHLSPDRESHLEGILQSHARMPVRQVTETVPLEANHVYLIPPNANIEAIDTHLRLSKLEERRQERAPVDHFFRTLARAHDGHAVGVILSGTGTDGALGVKAIKEGGGLTVVQAPADAEYDGMPQSAIATGIIDLVLPLAMIPEAVLSFARTQPRIPFDDEEEVADQTLVALQRVFVHLSARTGRDFTRYKRSTILRRIARRMQLKRVEELSGYLELLRESPEEASALADDLLITVTSFFRDPWVFDKLEQEVLPKIFARKRGEDEEVRVWSVGCATGEEAYSLAILLLEQVHGLQSASPRIQVFASDLHEHSLERARQGFYPGEIVADVSPERLARFFLKEDGGYRVRKEVRETVVFAPHNLLGDPPFSRIDLICCRNLLIYLQRDAQQEVDEIFHYALRPAGFLVVGGSETILSPELFIQEDKKAAIYRKRDVPTPEPRLPVFPIWRHQVRGRDAKSEGGERQLSYNELHQRILELEGPASALVGPDDKILNLTGNAGRYIVHPSGELTASVFKLVREELRLDLRAALSEIRRPPRAKKRTRPIRVQFNGEAHSVVLHVSPCREPHADGFALVVFDEWDSEREASAPAAEAAALQQQLPEVRQRELETELELGRQRLQAIIEEYESGQEEMKASNEELQSANEELRSTLEELETSKEELHSMNEELQTVNQENRHKVEELSQLSSDLQNLLAATQIATLFLDRDLRIMRFTPQVGELFNVRATDRGRPLSDLTHRLGYDELHEDAKRVLTHLVPIQREVMDDSDHVYLTRLFPYRSTQDRIDGVVITFIDLTPMKKVEEALRQSERKLSQELDAMVMLHEFVGRLFVCGTVEEGLSEVLDATIAMAHADMGDVQLFEADGTHAIAIQRGSGSRESLDERLERDPIYRQAFVTRKRVVVPDVEADPAYEQGRGLAAARRYRGTQSTPLMSRGGQILGMLSTHYAQPFQPSERDLRILDLYTRQAADFIARIRDTESLDSKTQELEEQDKRRSFFLATLSHELRNPLAALDNAFRLIQAGGNAEDLYSLMSSQMAQIKRLLDDLLEISRIARGKVQVRKTRTNLAELVRLGARSLENRLRAQEQQITLPADEPLWIQADPVRVEQVLTNLLDNASKFTPRGGHIEVDLALEDGQAVLSVRDEGCGLVGEDIHRVFEPFVQLGSHAGNAGMGIGLTLVKLLVEEHGGSIQAESEGLGQGSIFTVRLPVGGTSEGPAPAPEKQRRKESIPPSTRVLIIDDSRDNATSMAMLLELQGAEARCAFSGEEGLEVARTWQPHVALIDIALPDMAGFEVAKRLKKRSKQTLLIAVTGFGDQATKEKTVQAGFAEHLVKPIDHDKLHALIARHVPAAR
jgi:two-component system CheB/CheR fusion protein